MISQTAFYKGPLKKKKETRKSIKTIFISVMFIFLLLTFYLLKILIIQTVLPKLGNHEVFAVGYDSAQPGSGSGVFD